MDGFWLVDAHGRLLEVNEAACRMLGYSREEMVGMVLTDLEADETASEIAATMDRIRISGALHLERRQRRRDGQLIEVEIKVAHLSDASGNFAVFLRDITERKKLEELLSGQNRVLASIASGASLAATLDELLRVIESQAPEMLSSILLLDADGKHLRHGAAPRLPREYMQAIDGGSIGPCAGSCGTAAFRRETVIVTDIATDPLWVSYRELVLPHGLRACWSTPIFDAQRRVLGTFAMYFRQPGRPSKAQERLIEITTDIAAVAISRKWADDSLRRSETKFRTLHDSNHDGVLLLDESGFFDCNPAALKAFGCASREELCTKHPSDLSPVLQPGGMKSMTLANQRIAAALATGYQRFEWVHKRLDTSATFPTEVLLIAMDLDGKRVLQTTVRDISERWRAEAALRENEDRYRDLLDNSRELISTIDLEGNFLSVNQTTALNTGFSRDMLLRMNLVNLLAPETRHLFPEYLETIRTRGEAGGTMRIHTAKGERRVWEYRTSLRTEGVATPVVRAMALDITERLRAEKALRASYERFELANRATFNAIWDWDLETDAFWRNDNFEVLFGHAKEPVEPSSAGSFKLIHPEDFKRVRAGLTAALDSEGEFWADHYRFRRSDGSYAAVEDRAVITRDANGRALRMLGAMQDVSERQTAEAALRLQSGALQAAANTIIITDRLGLIEWANPAFSALTGYDLAEAVGKRPGDLLKSGNHDSAFYKSLWDTILSGKAWQGEFVNRRKNRSLYSEEMTITPLKDHNDEITHFVAVKQDITQRKLLEEQFRQSQKLEAVGRLAGGVAHDFNNMLAVILGYTEVALAQLDPSLPLHAELVQIEKAAARSADLTRQLLAFARREAIAPQVLNLNDTVAATLSMLTRLIGEDIQVVWRPASKLWPIKVDPTQIDQSLTNLCVNARDAISGVGTITIATANRTVDAAFCANHSDAVPGDYVLLSVSDTGCGISDEILSRIFEPFFTTKPVGEGTGLGLPTVYGAVKQNYGFITVGTVLGQGTTFEIHLPRCSERLNLEERPEVAPQTARGMETILVVEDEPALLKLLVAALTERGFSVLGAPGPQEGIRRAREHAGEIHLLLTDVIMPEMTGRDLAKALLSDYSRLKCVYMSGYTANAIAHGGVLDEGVHFLQKPFSIATLAAKLRAVLDGSD